MSKAGRIAVATAIAVGATAYSGLHLVAPPLSLTWAYAHLDLHPVLWAASLGAMLVFPLAAVAIGRSRLANLEVPSPPRWLALAAFLSLSLTFLAVGWFHPAKAVSLDAAHFAVGVWKGWPGTARWYLMIVTFSSVLRVAEWIAPFPVPARDLVPVVNAFCSGLSYVLLFGCARRLARGALEVAMVVALSWTAFGNLQLALYYVDIYPVVQLAFALFVWTSLRFLSGDGRLAAPVVIALLGPFFYAGLVLLLPATAVLCVVALRRPGGARDVAIAGTLGLLAAGSATLPAFGRPFAFSSYLQLLAGDGTRHLGLSPDTNLLPLGYLFTTAHVWEYAHTLILIDGIGVLLGVTAGLPLIARFLRGEMATPAGVLLLTAAPVLTYAYVMDPLWGAYADWDLFSYAAVPTSLFGGYAFVRWGRGMPDLRSALFGLLLAGSLMHLAARLNALEVESQRHWIESPSHVVGGPPGNVDATGPRRAARGRHGVEIRGPDGPVGLTMASRLGSH